MRTQELGQRSRLSTLGAFVLRFRRSRTGVIGFLVVTVMVLVALVGPALTPGDPFAVGAERLLPPDLSRPMGTDSLGRDAFTRFIHGARVSLLVGLVAAAIGMVIGILVGAVAGFFGKKVDVALMRMAEIFQVMPRFILALATIAILGAGIDRVIVVIGILSWPPIARVVRAEFLSLKKQPFVEAGVALGMAPVRLLFREILPNALPAVIVLASFDVAQAILLEAGLSFLGLGDPNVISWGSMLHEAQRFLTSAWWLAFFPGMGIFFMVLAFNLVGDGINDAQDPRLREH